MRFATLCVAWFCVSLFSLASARGEHVPSVAEQGLNAVNVEREKFHLPLLQADEALARAADYNSQLGGGHQYVISAQCWSGYPTIESSIQAWIYQDAASGWAHRQIILGNYRYAGFGGTEGNYTLNVR